MKTRLGFICFLVAASISAPLCVCADNPHLKLEYPKHVSMGTEIKLADYLAAGKTTIFDFTSEYCPPCRAIAPALAKLHASRADLAVVSVDINRAGVKGIDWKSPVARQYQLKSIPHFKIYGPTGELVAEGTEARAMVSKWLNQRGS